jgi:DNA-directed RNA polymerase specialized sigma24 family protein
MSPHATLTYTDPVTTSDAPSPTGPPSADAYPATRSSLLSRVRHPSDVEGWREFHTQYQRLVFSVCLNAGLGQQDAEDVSQEALAAVAKALPAFTLDRKKGAFRGWLYRITSNKVNDFLRKKYREGAVRSDVPSFLKEGVADDADLIGTVWDAEWMDIC